MNVFEYSLPWSHRLRHPLQYLRFLARACRNACQRIAKGYCDFDIMDIDDWLLSVLPAMLKELAGKPAYPGYEPFDTPEKWEAWLNDTAAKLTSYREDWAETRNEYEKEYQDRLDKCIEKSGYGLTTWSCDYSKDPGLLELKDKWSARIKELDAVQCFQQAQTFAEIGENLKALWW